MPEFHIRPLRSSDFDRVLHLEHELFGRGAWTYGMLADELAGLGRWYIVATVDEPGSIGPDPVVGYAGLWFDGDDAQVMTIGVARNYQRCGVGRRLLDELIGRARAVKAGAVLLEVRVDNEAALTMYRHVGFEVLATRKRYYQPEDMDAYTMKLDLRPERQADPSPGAGDGDATCAR